jgi:hypothetical protein
VGRTGALVGIVGVLALAGAAVYAAWFGDVRSAVPARNVTPPTERVRVEVLNAGGVSGQARAATLELRDIGFDVVHYGNADRFDRETSAVVDRVGRPDLARSVAAALGIASVQSEPDPNLFVDVTVLLGREWRGAQEAVATDGDAPERERWDPRRWIGR